MGSRFHERRAAAVVFAWMLGASASAPAAVWYFNDNEGSGSIWGDDPFVGWERMHSEALESDACSWVALPATSSQAYVAYSDPPETSDYSSQVFWSEVWLANTAPGSRIVRAQLHRGTPGSIGPILATAQRTVYNTGPPQMYVFDFGVVSEGALNEESFLVLLYDDGDPGETYIFWDSTDCPSALHAQGAIRIDPGSWGRVKGLYQ